MTQHYRSIVRFALLVAAIVAPHAASAAIFDAVAFMDSLTAPGATVQGGLDFSLIGGNTRIRRAGGAIGGAVRGRTWSTMLWVGGEYERAGSDTVAQAVLEHGRVRRDLGSGFAWEGFLQHEYDRQQRIATRVLAGTGPRYAVVTTRVTFATGALPMYEYLRIDEQQALSDRGDRVHEARLSMYLRADLAINEHVAVDINGYWQPRLDDWADARLSGNAGLSAGLNDWLTLTLRGAVAWDRTPAVAVETLDYRISTGIEIDWTR